MSMIQTRRNRVRIGGIEKRVVRGHIVRMSEISNIKLVYLAACLLTVTIDIK